MAEIRTEEQREEIAQECLRIEKAGGDVLGYLHGLNYISARATWIRLQKEFLGRRKEWQLTDGKPKTKEEKEEVKMDDQTEMVVQPVDPAELGEAEREPVTAGPEENDGFLVTAVQCAGLGEFYYDHLHECIDWRDGYGDEISLGVDGWRMLMERLPAILARLGVTV